MIEKQNDSYTNKIKKETTTYIYKICVRIKINVARTYLYELTSIKPPPPSQNRISVVEHSIDLKFFAHNGCT
jgi:hypothetical protein